MVAGERAHDAANRTRLSGERLRPRLEPGQQSSLCLSSRRRLSGICRPVGKGQTGRPFVSASSGKRRSAPSRGFCGQQPLWDFSLPSAGAATLDWDDEHTTVSENPSLPLFCSLVRQFTISPSPHRITSDQALADNSLVIAWPELSKLALADRTRAVQTQHQVF